MRVMMIIKSDADSEAGKLPSEEILTAMGAYNDQLIKAGVVLGGEGLQASSKGARIRVSGGDKVKVSDGPFTEAKELIAGYWILKVDSLADAVAWARKIPGVADGEVELREIYETEDFAVDPAEKPDGWRDKEQEMRAAQPPPRKPGTQRWMLVLKADKNTEAAFQPGQKLFTEMGALMGEIAAQGALLAGDGLKPSSRAAKVRHKGGKVTVVDGPFTEAKELIAGFTIVQGTKQQAIDWATRVVQIHVAGTPIDHGECDVRQIFEIEDFAVDPAEKPGGWRDKEQAFRDKTGE